MGISALRQPKVIHLDLNGTCVAFETIHKKRFEIEQYVQNMMAVSTIQKWDGVQKESYKDYVWRVLHPGKNSDVELRKKRKESLQNFVDDQLKQKTKYAKDLKNTYGQLIDVLSKSPVFEGLDRLVEDLILKEKNVRLHFRTFGGDLDYIAEHFKTKHPSLQFLRAEFDADRKFHYKGEDQVMHTVEKIEEVYALFQKHNFFVQDHFDTWRKAEETSQGGKLFPFSQKDGLFSLFLDDNARIADSPQERGIVCAYDIDQKKMVGTAQAGKRIIPVDPIQAALNPNYLTLHARKALLSWKWAQLKIALSSFVKKKWTALANRIRSFWAWMVQKVKGVTDCFSSRFSRKESEGGSSTCSGTSSLIRQLPSSSLSSRT